MAMAGHLQLKQPGRWSVRSESLHSVTAARPHRCSCRPATNSVPTSGVRSGGDRLRHGFLLRGGNSRTRDGFSNLGFGARVVAAGGEGEAGDEETVADDVESDDNSSFPAEFKELIVDRGDPPNLYLYAAGAVVVVFMRDVILQEIARWGFGFARIALYIAEGITLGVYKLMEVGAEPVALFMDLATWVAGTVGNAYAHMVDAPVQTLTATLFLSLAVVSIGEAATCKVKGSRSQLVSIATAIGVAGVLELIPADLMLLSLVLLTAYAKFVQKADIITVFMPATVTFVAISPPLLRAAAFGLFLIVSVYANWRSAREAAEPEPTPESDVAALEAPTGKSLSPVFLAVTTSICVSLSARFLYLRTVQWLLLRTA